MRVVFVVSQVTIKAPLITRGLRLNDPVEAVLHPTRELEGEFHKLRPRNFAFYIPTTILRNNFAMSRVCNTIKYRSCTRHFFNCPSFHLKIFHAKRCLEKPPPPPPPQFTGKNDIARALRRPFPLRQ